MKLVKRQKNSKIKKMPKLTKIDDLKFYYRSNDRFIGQRIALDKYEKYETALLLSQINKNSICVDVGANIGYYTLLMARKSKKVYAFEPDKKSFEILKKNVEENGLKNVVLVNIGVSNKRGKKYLVRDKDNFGNSRINDKNGEIIFTDSLDNILINEQEISLIKIDTQGHEPEVIGGAKKIIKSSRPILFLEYTPGEYKDRKMINFLKKNYDNIFSISDFAEVPWPIKRGVKVDKHSYSDLFLKEKMKIGDYWAMLKNVNYRKWLKGIMNYGKNKTY